VTEQQRYEVAGQYPGFELRHYPAHLVADVEVEGSFQDAGNAGFRPLFDYIRGQNQTGQSIAMTAPVLQHRNNTMPTMTTETTLGRYIVSFVMPDSTSRESLPDPGDERVTLRQVPEQLTAATRYTGRWTPATYQQHLDRLRQAIRDAGLEPTNPASFARYDPPWTPWFRRRNEVLLPVGSP
jgi:hypothetical protein